MSNIKFNNFTLKLIALLFMTIDHIGIHFLKHNINENYLFCRLIGRCAAPIFFYLLVEGYFKNKNLILFMAESYNMIAVNKELTPTLYKLTNEGFVFNNFYTPVNNSTIGGEFQELTGLYANGSILKIMNGAKVLRLL